MKRRLASLIVFALVVSCRASDSGGRQAPSELSGGPARPDMALAEPGAFMMGDDTGAPDERPVHRVAITRALYVAVLPVTCDEYARFCDDTGRAKPASRWSDGGSSPAIGVDWYDAVAYCNWLSSKHGLRPCYAGAGIVTTCDFDADGYRLPTEAEWEWVARGGTAGRGYRYAGGDDPVAVAWFSENSGDRTHRVGSLSPNELGVYDMSGNMYEWCWDFYARDAYARSEASDPAGPRVSASDARTPRGPERVRRSGSWRENRDAIRSTYRSRDYAGYPGDNGFRLFRTAIPAG